MSDHDDAMSVDSLNAGEGADAIVNIDDLVAATDAALAQLRAEEDSIKTERKRRRSSRAIEQPSSVPNGEPAVASPRRRSTRTRSTDSSAGSGTGEAAAAAPTPAAESTPESTPADVTPPRTPRTPNTRPSASSRLRSSLDSAGSMARLSTDSSPRASPGTTPSRLARLYARHRMIEQKKKALAEKLFQESHPFKPEINTHSTHLLAGRPATGDVGKALYEDAAKRSAKVKEKADAHVASIAPFKPTLTAATPERVQERYETARLAFKNGVHEMLYNQREHYAEQLEVHKAAKEARMMKDCTFKPDLSNSRPPSVDNHVPAVKRLHPTPADLESKAEQREALRAARELKDCTFRPTISDSPNASKTERSGDVHDRLYAESAKGRKKIEDAIKEKAEAEVKACSFKPKITEYRRNAPASNTPWHQRLYQDAKSRKSKLKEKEEEGLREKCSFAPTIHDSPTGLRRRRSSASPRYLQLYKQGTEAGRTRHEWTPPQDPDSTFMSQLRSSPPAGSSGSPRKQRTPGSPQRQTRQQLRFEASTLSPQREQEGSGSGQGDAAGSGGSGSRPAGGSGDRSGSPGGTRSTAQAVEQQGSRSTSPEGAVATKAAQAAATELVVPGSHTQQRAEQRESRLPGGHVTRSTDPTAREGADAWHRGLRSASAPAKAKHVQARVDPELAAAAQRVGSGAQSATFERLYSAGVERVKEADKNTPPHLARPGWSLTLRSAKSVPSGLAAGSGAQTAGTGGPPRPARASVAHDRLHLAGTQASKGKLVAGRGGSGSVDGSSTAGGEASGSNPDSDDPLAQSGPVWAGSLRSTASMSSLSRSSVRGVSPAHERLYKAGLEGHAKEGGEEAQGEEPALAGKVWAGSLRSAPPPNAPRPAASPEVSEAHERLYRTSIRRVQSEDGTTKPVAPVRSVKPWSGSLRAVQAAVALSSTSSSSSKPSPVHERLYRTSIGSKKAANEAAGNQEATKTAEEEPVQSGWRHATPPRARPSTVTKGGKAVFAWGGKTKRVITPRASSAGSSGRPAAAAASPPPVPGDSASNQSNDQPEDAALQFV